MLGLYPPSNAIIPCVAFVAQPSNACFHRPKSAFENLSHVRSHTKPPRSPVPLPVPGACCESRNTHRFPPPRSRSTSSVPDPHINLQPRQPDPAPLSHNPPTLFFYNHSQGGRHVTGASPPPKHNREAGAWDLRSRRSKRALNPCPGREEVSPTAVTPRRMPKYLELVKSAQSWASGPWNARDLSFTPRQKPLS